MLRTDLLCFQGGEYDDQAVFQLQPMTFNDPDTGQPFPIWVDYYEKLGVKIPEGEPGLNPGGISRSAFIEIVHYYGQPDIVEQGKKGATTNTRTHTNSPRTP